MLKILSISCAPTMVFCDYEIKYREKITPEKNHFRRIWSLMLNNCEWNHSGKSKCETIFRRTVVGEYGTFLWILLMLVCRLLSFSENSTRSTLSMPFTFNALHVAVEYERARDKEKGKKEQHIGKTRQHIGVSFHTIHFFTIFILNILSILLWIWI